MAESDEPKDGTWEYLCTWKVNIRTDEQDKFFWHEPPVELSNAIITYTLQHSNKVSEDHLEQPKLDFV